MGSHESRHQQGTRTVVTLALGPVKVGNGGGGYQCGGGHVGRLASCSGDKWLAQLG